MKQIIKALKFQDIFNSTFYYFFNKKRKQHTALTIIISLGINILSISLFLTEISDLIKHKNPTVNYAKLRNSISPNLTLNTKELLFSIGVRDKNYNFINDPSLVTIKPLPVPRFLSFPKSNIEEFSSLMLEIPYYLFH